MSGEHDDFIIKLLDNGFLLKFTSGQYYHHTEAHLTLESLLKRLEELLK